MNPAVILPFWCTAIDDIALKFVYNGGCTTAMNLKAIYMGSSCPAGSALIEQTPPGDNAQLSWTRKCNPAKISAGQSESTSCAIA